MGLHDLHTCEIGITSHHVRLSDTVFLKQISAGTDVELTELTLNPRRVVLSVDTVTAMDIQLRKVLSRAAGEASDEQIHREIYDAHELAEFKRRCHKFGGGRTKISLRLNAHRYFPGLVHKIRVLSKWFATLPTHISSEHMILQEKFPRRVSKPVHCVTL